MSDERDPAPRIERVTRSVRRPALMSGGSLKRIVYRETAVSLPRVPFIDGPATTEPQDPEQ